MDCPTCQFSVVEREGTLQARLFQCRHDDSQYMIARGTFDAFVALTPEVRFAALQAARRRSGQAVPVITAVDMAMEHAWRDPVIDTQSVKVVRPESAMPPRARNDH
ncbi:MAG: hypothetical protein QM759_08410 [Terricaulis sp.]